MWVNHMIDKLAVICIKRGFYYFSRRVQKNCTANVGLSALLALNTRSRAKSNEVLTGHMSEA